MKISKKGVGPKDILSRAVALAARGESEQAARSFETCVKAYAQQGLPLRALAAAKAARSALGESPKVQAMLVRLYTELGLAGDAQKEIESGSKLVRKDAIPLLKGLGNDEMTDLLDIMELLPVKKGAYVVRQSEKGEDLYLVAAGTYEVMRDALRVSLMHAGDVFGEIGFFHHAARSASVRAMEDGMLIRLPADELRGLCRKYPALAHALERLYFARVIKKASEDLAINAGDLNGICEMHFPKGQELSRLDGITIVKHGVVEIDYDSQGLTRKRFLGPGSVFKHTDGRARANTDVDIIQAQPDIPS